MTKVSHLIIGGVTRAGTTSLFNYLSHHVQICGATRKETRFFLNEKYPLSRVHYFTEEDEKYNTFFANCGGREIRLEATPDYLYSIGTAERISSVLPQVGLIFILREPIERLLSWFRFAKQNGYLDTALTIDEYVLMQRDVDVFAEDLPQELRALEQGRYCKYLKAYYDIYVSDKILITTIEALERDPKGVLLKICNFAGIDPSFYDSYTFEVSNQSFVVKKQGLQMAYWRVSKRLRVMVHNQPFIRKVFRKIWHTIRPFYMRYNQATDEAVEISPELQLFLDDYYDGESQKLAELLGLPEWSWALPEKAIVRQ